MYLYKENPKIHKQSERKKWFLPKKNPNPSRILFNKR